MTHSIFNCSAGPFSGKILPLLGRETVVALQAKYLEALRKDFRLMTDNMIKVDVKYCP